MECLNFINFLNDFFPLPVDGLSGEDLQALRFGYQPFRCCVHGMDHVAPGGRYQERALGPFVVHLNTKIQPYI